MNEETEPKELKWLREYSNSKRELKENALKNNSLPDFAGFDLEFWKKIYEEGKQDGLKMKFNTTTISDAPLEQTEGSKVKNVLERLVRAVVSTSSTEETIFWLNLKRDAELIWKELEEPKKNHWYEMYELECLKTKELEKQIEKGRNIIHRLLVIIQRHKWWDYVVIDEARGFMSEVDKCQKNTLNR